MRKAIAPFVGVFVLILALIQNASAAPLNHRAEMNTLIQPAYQYDYQTFLDALDQFAGDHPALMPEDHYAILSALSHEAVDLFSVLDVKYDPFEDRYSIYDSVNALPSEENPLIFYVSGSNIYYAIALYDDTNWINATSITFLFDGQRYSDETHFEQDYLVCEDNRRMEFIVGSARYYGFPPEQIIESAAFRVYGLNGDKDVFCDDYIVDHFNRIYAASTMNSRISDALFAWCRAIDSIVE